MNLLEIDEIIINALKEDIGNGDITTDSLISPESESKGIMTAKESGILAGIDIAERVFKILDPSIRFAKNFNDGQALKVGDVICQIEGNTRVMLKAERLALNILQRMSGIASNTHRYCQEVKGYQVRVVDTRKTTPCLRMFEKYAVLAGGGHNHRVGLYDGVSIKDNHIKAVGGIKKAIEIARGQISHLIKIEVETETIEQVKEALEAKADVIMLDNMDMKMMKEAVQMIAGRAIVEASGNVTIGNIREVASTGVDVISVGALTHSVCALDISMRIQ